jgi:hypothetical protein
VDCVTGFNLAGCNLRPSITLVGPYTRANSSLLTGTSNTEQDLYDARARDRVSGAGTQHFRSADLPSTNVGCGDVAVSRRR